MENPNFYLEGIVRDKNEMQDFEGPLSLILQLLSKNKIEIRDIRISEILDQYLAYLDEMRAFEALQQVLPELKAASERGMLYCAKAPEPLRSEQKEYSYRHEPIDLLRAMARMKTRRTLDVVGAGNLEPALRALADKLGLADRVRFRGFQTDPQAWMRAAACVVVPSFWQEPYGLVAAEAVALGRPVVAFAIGGLPEACGGRATLVPPGDVAALARALDAAPVRPPDHLTT